MVKKEHCRLQEEKHRLANVALEEAWQNWKSFVDEYWDGGVLKTEVQESQYLRQKYDTQKASLEAAIRQRGKEREAAFWELVDCEVAAAQVAWPFH